MYFLRNIPRAILWFKHERLHVNRSWSRRAKHAVWKIATHDLSRWGIMLSPAGNFCLPSWTFCRPWRPGSVSIFNGAAAALLPCCYSSCITITPASPSAPLRPGVPPHANYATRNIRYDNLLLRFTRKMTRNLKPYPISCLFCS